MISVSSAAPSNSDAPGRKGRRRLVPLILLPALAVLILGLGPTVCLNLLLSRWAEGGAGLACGQARAGWFFRWVEVTDLTVDQWPTPLGPAALSVASVRLDGLSFLNFIKYVRQPSAQRPEPRFLTGTFNLRRLALTLPGRELAVAELAGRGLSLPPAPANRPGTPLFFDQLDVEGLIWQAEAGALKLGRLEAGRLGPETLAGLTVRGLNLELGAENTDRPAWTIDGLTVEGLDNGAIIRALTAEEQAVPLWLLSAVDTLNLTRAVFSVGGREALTLKTARFGAAETGAGGAVTYHRYIDFFADLPLLTNRLDKPLRRGLRDLAGDRVNGEMELTLDYQRSTGQADLRGLRLDIPALGRLTASGRLSGVQALRPHLSPSQILFGAGTWRLNDLSLSFADQGFMANLYRHLDRTVFRHSPRRPTPANIDEYYLQPWARRLRDEAGLANLSALMSEARIFLEQPAGISLIAGPKTPWPVAAAFANPDKYDILEKLCLIIQVNGRTPVALAVNAGVLHERLPSSPKPMGHLFEEEDI